MNTYQRIILLIFCTFLLINPAVSLDIELVKEKTLQGKMDAAKEDKGLDEETKTNLLSLYSKTLEFLEEIKANEKKTQEYIQSRSQTPEKIEALQKKLENLEKNPTLKGTAEELAVSIEKVSLSDLEQKLSTESANLAAIEANNANYTQILSSEADSAPDIRKRLIETNQILEQLIEDKKLTSSGVTSEQIKAEKWLVESHIEAIKSEIKMLDQQLLTQPMRLKLLNLTKEHSDYKLRNIRLQVRFIEQQVDLKRSSEIKKTQEITREEQAQAVGKHELIQELAQLNTQLSEDITKKTEELSILEAGDDFANKETKRLYEEQISTKKKLEIAGLNHILGQVLLEQKRALPDSSLYLKNLDNREALIARSGLQNIQYQEEIRKIKHSNEYLSELMKEIPDEVQLQIKDDLLDLVQTRKKLLKKAISIDESYIKAIAELDFAEKKLIQIATSYSQLIDEHLLWLRSAPPINLDNIKNIPEQVIFFLSPIQWLGFVNDFIHMLNSSLFILPGVLFIIFLFIKKHKLESLIVHTGQKTKRISNDRLLHTFKVIFYTLLLASPFPLLMLLVDWQFSKMTEISEFSQAMAIGMKIIILPLFCLQIFRSMCIPGGLFEIHFKWSLPVIDGLRKEMGRLMFTLLPAIFITGVLISKSGTFVNGGLGRLSLLVTLLTFAVFFYRLLKPGTGFLQLVAEQNPKGMFARFQGLWFYLSLILVVFLMGLTIIGYVYTAGQLTHSLVYTVWFIFFLIILQQIAVRWLLLTRRRFALKTAYEKHKASQALKNNDEETDSTGKEPERVMDIEEPVIDMVSLSEESIKLLNLLLFVLGASGLIAIWAEVLPALGIFEQIELWHYKGVIDGTEKLLPVTLGDLGFAVLVAIITFFSAQRLPAIIEILLIQTSVSSGNRYTVTTLINYTIIGIGFFSVFNIMGADWAKFQWLFAALSVGIGFGLQEIVANFISGIIILFERPIRVGDYVSVGENEGIVSRIQIRATTILTRDRKELLVPNKEFITGQLLNWSLSDPTARLIIPVGVAYGSDIPKARALLIEAAEEHERVLTEPAPRVLFFNFGDNTLDLQLRCFIGNVDFRLDTISAINEAINTKFNAAGISISFPQRDVHLDITQPIDIRLQGAAE
ncbi:MAG: mechanosensitive ion channel [Gammaproteobacteria bacterium]|nr:mechanosensitive ion channel [Gammaproteobacteria bacterium]